MSGSVSLSFRFSFPVDAVGVVAHREDNGEKDEKYCEPAVQPLETLVLVASTAVPGDRRRREREERERVAESSHRF